MVLPPRTDEVPQARGNGKGISFPFFPSDLTQLTPNRSATITPTALPGPAPMAPACPCPISVSRISSHSSSSHTACVPPCCGAQDPQNWVLILDKPGLASRVHSDCSLDPDNEIPLTSSKERPASLGATREAHTESRTT